MKISEQEEWEESRIDQHRPIRGPAVHWFDDPARRVLGERPGRIARRPALHAVER